MPDPRPIGQFASGRFRANPLVASEAPALQAFFGENPEYFVAVNGIPPRPCEAQDEFDDLPPPDMSFNEKWLIGFTDPTGKLVGFAGVLSDFLAPRVWHIGIFIVASSLHGTGAALALYETLQRWMAANGAAWIRLGVVEGNVKAERFWHKTGYQEVRKRLGITMGTRMNDVRVLVKPLEQGSIAEYLTLVARDHPDSERT